MLSVGAVGAMGMRRREHGQFMEPLVADLQDGLLDPNGGAEQAGRCRADFPVSAKAGPELDPWPKGKDTASEHTARS